jgi:hypothetical protein
MIGVIYPDFILNSNLNDLYRIKLSKNVIQIKARLIREQGLKEIFFFVKNSHCKRDS